VAIKPRQNLQMNRLIKLGNNSKQNMVEIPMRRNLLLRLKKLIKLRQFKQKRRSTLQLKNSKLKIMVKCQMKNSLQKNSTI
jgi:hypothetical protein